MAICDDRLVLLFDVVRLSAPVPWLSGRASASHAEGRWFDPSRDHPYIPCSEPISTQKPARSGYPQAISGSLLCLLRGVRFRFMLDV